MPTRREQAAFPSTADSKGSADGGALARGVRRRRELGGDDRFNRRSRLAGWLSLAWSVVMAVVLTWPSCLYPSYAAIGSGYADGLKHLWTLWWMRASVWEHGAFPFHTELVNYPVGMDLYPIEPLNGLVAVALPFVDLLAMSNGLILINLVLTGVVGAWFGREVSGRAVGGFVAGTLLEGSAVMAFFVHVGVGELTHLWLLPLGLGVLVRARRTGEPRWFLAVSGVLVLAMVACFYLGFFLAVATLVWALCTLWAGRGTPVLLGKYVLAAALAMAVVVPVTRSFSASYKSGDVPLVGLQSYLFEEHGQPITDPASARLEPAHLLTPQRPAESRETKGYGGGRYLGWLACGLALAGVVRRPREGAPWLVVGVVGTVLALGSFLTVDGEVLLGGNRYRMPIFYLNRVLGYYAEPLNFPVRFLAVTVTALAAMGALAVRSWGALLAPLAALEIAWGQQIDRPWATFRPMDASSLASLEAEGHAMVDLSLVVRADVENRWASLSAQLEHGHPLTGVPVERLEYFARDGLWFVKALPLFEDLAPLYQDEAGAALAGGPEAYRKSLALLHDAGIDRILVHFRAGRQALPGHLVAELNTLCGPPLAGNGTMAVWTLPQVQATDSELEMWREWHQSAIDHVKRRDPGMGNQLR